MSKTLQFRRYANTVVATTTGAAGELIVDSTNSTITVHDGVTAGGKRLATEAYALANAANVILSGNIAITGIANVTGNIVATTITTATGSAKNLVIDPDGVGDLIITACTEVLIQSTQASVNANSGALVISGGLGVNGNVYANVIYSSNGVGYPTGSGGVVTQATSRTTGVTLNKSSGQITLFSLALAAGTGNTFIFTNSNISANDYLMINHFSGGTLGNYIFASNTSAGQANVTVKSSTTVAAEAPVLQYVVIKGAAT